MEIHPFLQPDEFIAFAHRGGSLEAPENTMAAFQACVDLGYGYIETDAVATADGKLLCFHDDRLDRLTDQTGIIGEMTYAEVRSARVADLEPIPLMEDVLTAWPKVKFNIEPKNDGAVDGLLQAIERTGTLNRVCLGSFAQSRLDRIRAAMDGTICTALGEIEVRRMLLAGLRLPVRRITGACAQVPMRRGRFPVVTRRLVKTAERLGLRVHVWTIDRRDEMEQLLDLGVHGIMTDRPTLLKAVLQERGMWIGH